MVFANDKGAVALPFFVVWRYSGCMILLDGKNLSQKLLEELKQEVLNMKKKLRLAIVMVGNDPVTLKFIERKKKMAAEIGVDVRIYPFDDTITTNELRKRIAKIVHEEKNTAVIIQLPLPKHINEQYVLNAVTPEKDVDVLSAHAVGNFAVGKLLVLPPVVGAIKIFFEEYGIEYQSKYIVVVGAGRLVGRPISMWLLNAGATFSVVRSSTPDISVFTKQADIIISGVGKPDLITGGMVKDGVIVIDVGLSEIGGRLVGDCNFDSVLKKASYITPVPGGVGPLAVATIFKNLLTLVKAKKS